MKLWQPHRLQWRVIWIVYAVSFLGSLARAEREYSPVESVIVTYVVIAGALILWWMQTKREK